MSMKRFFASFFLIPLLAISFTFLTFYGAAAQTQSLAIVDVKRLLEESKAAQSIQKQVSEKRQVLEDEFANFEDQLRENEKSLAEKRAEGDQEGFAKQRQEYERTLMETRSLVQQKKRALEEAVLQATGRLRQEILKITAGIAEEEGYDVVLTRQNVVIVDKSMDITAEVMTRLNKSLTDIKLDVSL